MAEGGEEDRAKHGDSKRSRELLHGFQNTGGGADLVHAHAGEDELEELADAGTRAYADQEEAGQEIPGRRSMGPTQREGDCRCTGGDQHDPDMEEVTSESTHRDE